MTPYSSLSHMALIWSTVMVCILCLKELRKSESLIQPLLSNISAIRLLISYPLDFLRRGQTVQTSVASLSIRLQQKDSQSFYILQTSTSLYSSWGGKIQKLSNQFLAYLKILHLWGHFCLLFDYLSSWDFLPYFHFNNLLHILFKKFFQNLLSWKTFAYAISVHLQNS